MVTIYALINPLNNEPFYVGSTTMKLKHKLGQHKNLSYGTKDKREFIRSINEQGLSIYIIPLMECENDIASNMENNCYLMMVKLGYKMLQDGSKAGSRQKDYSYSHKATEFTPKTNHILPDNQPLLNPPLLP